jgi:hypothetical protein
MLHGSGACLMGRREFTGLFVPVVCVVLALVAPAAAQSPADIAKAYVQAIAGGAKSKAAGSIDFAALGCAPATVFDQGSCQKIVKDGKDGKTFLMEAITQANIADLVPTADVKRVFAHVSDMTYPATREMFLKLSTSGNGWFHNLEGNGKAKAILQGYLEQIGSGGLYATFAWPFDTAHGAEAHMIAVGVSLRFNTLPSAQERAKMAATGYFWALQTNLTAMEFPAGFVAPASPGLPKGKDCKNTTTAWGHIGFQLHKDGLQRINWGGGGNGSGGGDYGCGGSDLTPTPFEVGPWYDYKVVRGERLGPKLWLWVGEIHNRDKGVRIYQKTIYGGEFLNGAMTWIETFNRLCADPKVSTEWKEPWVGNFDAGNKLKKFRVGRVSLDLPNDACLRSREDIVSTCTAEWRQDVGAVWKKAPDGSPLPPDPARQNDLRPLVNTVRLEESYCARAPDATEIEIASAYVNAISGGTQRAVPSGVDYERLGCDASSVRDRKKCQAAVFNGQDGQTVLMNAITPATGGDWRTSNIKRLIPEAVMRRIDTDPHLAQTKQLFGDLSDPGNDSYPWLAKPGMAKDVLRQYMNAVR